MSNLPPELALRMTMRQIVKQAAPEDMAQAYPQTFIGIADRISDEMLRRGVRFVDDVSELP